MKPPSPFFLIELELYMKRTNGGKHKEGHNTGGARAGSGPKKAVVQKTGRKEDFFKIHVKKTKAVHPPRAPSIHVPSTASSSSVFRPSIIVEPEPSTFDDLENTIDNADDSSDENETEGDDDDQENDANVQNDEEEVYEDPVDLPQSVICSYIKKMKQECQVDIEKKGVRYSYYYYNYFCNIIFCVETI